MNAITPNRAVMERITISTFKPIFRCSFLQHILNGTHGDDQKEDAPPIYFFRFHRPRPVSDKGPRQKSGDNSNRNIDKEYPMPGNMISNVSTQGRTESGPHDHAYTEDGIGCTDFVRRKRSNDDGLSRG